MLGMRRVFVLFFLFFSVSGCTKAVIPDRGAVPVPVRSERLEFTFPVDMDQVADSVVSMIRTGVVNPDPGEAPPVCTHRTDEEVRVEILPALTRIETFEFISPFDFNDRIRRLIGGEAEGTLNVADARRSRSCREWRPEGACGAFRYKGLWFLLQRIDSVPGPVQRMEVFFADLPCRGEVPHADAR